MPVFSYLPLQYFWLFAWYALVLLSTIFAAEQDRPSNAPESRRPYARVNFQGSTTVGRIAEVDSVDEEEEFVALSYTQRSTSTQSLQLYEYGQPGRLESASSGEGVRPSFGSLIPETLSSDDIRSIRQRQTDDRRGAFEEPRGARHFARSDTFRGDPSSSNSPKSSPKVNNAAISGSGYAYQSIGPYVGGRFVNLHSSEFQPPKSPRSRSRPRALQTPERRRQRLPALAVDPSASGVPQLDFRSVNKRPAEEAAPSYTNQEIDGLLSEIRETTRRLHEFKVQEELGKLLALEEELLAAYESRQVGSAVINELLEPIQGEILRQSLKLSMGQEKEPLLTLNTLPQSNDGPLQSQRDNALDMTSETKLPKSRKNSLFELPEDFLAKPMSLTGTKDGRKVRKEKKNVTILSEGRDISVAGMDSAAQNESSTSSSFEPVHNKSTGFFKSLFGQNNTGVSKSTSASDSHGSFVSKSHFAEAKADTASSPRSPRKSPKRLSITGITPVVYPPVFSPKKKRAHFWDNLLSHGGGSDLVVEAVVDKEAAPVETDLEREGRRIRTQHLRNEKFCKSLYLMRLKNLKHLELYQGAVANNMATERVAEPAKDALLFTSTEPSGGNAGPMKSPSRNRKGKGKSKKKGSSDKGKRQRPKSTHFRQNFPTFKSLADFLAIHILPSDLFFPNIFSGNLRAYCQDLIESDDLLPSTRSELMEAAEELATKLDDFDRTLIEKVLSDTSKNAYGLHCNNKVLISILKDFLMLLLADHLNPQSMVFPSEESVNAGGSVLTEDHYRWMFIIMISGCQTEGIFRISANEERLKLFDRSGGKLPYAQMELPGFTKNEEIHHHSRAAQVDSYPKKIVDQRYLQSENRKKSVEALPGPPYGSTYFSAPMSRNRRKLPAALNEFTTSDTSKREMTEPTIIGLQIPPVRISDFTIFEITALFKRLLANFHMFSPIEICLLYSLLSDYDLLDVDIVHQLNERMAVAKRRKSSSKVQSKGISGGGGGAEHTSVIDKKEELLLRRIDLAITEIAMLICNTGRSKLILFICDLILYLDAFKETTKMPKSNLVLVLANNMFTYSTVQADLRTSKTPLKNTWIRFLTGLNVEHIDRHDDPILDIDSELQFSTRLGKLMMFFLEFYPDIQMSIENAEYHFKSSSNKTLRSRRTNHPEKSFRPKEESDNYFTGYVARNLQVDAHPLLQHSQRLKSLRSFQHSAAKFDRVQDLTQ